MTEVDYSPHARQQYLASRARTGNWIAQQSGRYENPFTAGKTAASRNFDPLVSPDDSASQIGSSRPSYSRHSSNSSSRTTGRSYYAPPPPVPTAPQARYGRTPMRTTSGPAPYHTVQIVPQAPPLQHALAPRPIPQRSQTINVSPGQAVYVPRGGPVQVVAPRKVELRSATFPQPFPVAVPSPRSPSHSRTSSRSSSRTKTSASGKTSKPPGAPISLLKKLFIPTWTDSGRKSTPASPQAARQRRHSTGGAAGFYYH